MACYKTNGFVIFYGNEVAPVSLSKVVRLLNELSEENERLKNEREKLKSILDGNED